MAAVVGLAAEKIDELFRLLPKGFIRNYTPHSNCPVGNRRGLGQAEELCKKAGARRYIRLKVSGPFHSPLLEEAREEFAETVKAYTFKDPSKTLYSNVTGGKSPPAMRRRSYRQLRLSAPSAGWRRRTSFSKEATERSWKPAPGRFFPACGNLSARNLPVCPAAPQSRSLV